MYNRRKKCCCMNNNMDDYNDMLEKNCSNIDNENHQQYDSCSCGFDEEESLFPSNPVLAQSYVPWQIMNRTFTPEVGLKMGTIFPELVSPYMPGQSMEEIEYIAKTNTIGEGCNR